jgi:hypothetical protein
MKKMLMVYDRITYSKRDKIGIVDIQKKIKHEVLEELPCFFGRFLGY